MCLSWWVFFSETVYIYLNHIVFQIKDGLDYISTIIVFGLLEIQSNNVPVDDIPYQDIFLIKLIKKYLYLFGVWILFSTTW